MHDIIYILGALNVFYNSAHWRSKGPLFYQDHLLFARLYEKIDDEIDELVELIIGATGDDSFVEPKIFNEKVQSFTPEGSVESKTNLIRALNLEEGLLARISSFDEKEVGVGIYNQLAEIAESHTRNLYLIKQTLK